MFMRAVEIGFCAALVAAPLHSLNCEEISLRVVGTVQGPSLPFPQAETTMVVVPPRSNPSCNNGRFITSSALTGGSAPGKIPEGTYQAYDLDGKDPPAIISSKDLAKHVEQALRSDDNIG